MHRCAKHRERGVVMVWVVMALVALLGMAALTIDVGRLVIVAQNVQDVVDAAALGAAGELPDQAVATQTAHELVTANNNASSIPEVSVEAADIAFFSEGQTLEGYGIIGENTEAVTVSGQTQVDYIFAGIFGLQSTIITRSAAATRTAGATTWPVIFAHEDAPGTNGITWSGSGGQVDGDIHSNCKIKISGSGHIVTGIAEHVSGIKITGSGNEIQGGTVVGSVEPYPLDTIPRSAVEPDTYDYYYSTYNISGAGVVIPPGRYYCTGDFRVSGSNVSANNVTVVAEDDIKISGAGTTFTNCTLIAGDDINISGAGGTFAPVALWAHDRISISGAGHTLPALDTVFAYSESTYQYAISISGAGNNCEGTIFAPNGGIKYSGAGNGVQHGSLVAETVKISGAGFHIWGTEGPGAPAAPTIALVR